MYYVVHHLAYIILNKRNISVLAPLYFVKMLTTKQQHLIAVKVVAPLVKKQTLVRVRPV